MTVYHFKGRMAVVAPDPEPENPRDFEGDCVFVCFHKRYRLGDRTDYKSSAYSGWAELKRAIVKEHKPMAIQPLYMLDHSGLSFSIEPFGDPWDSGQVGFVYVPKKKASTRKSAERAIKLEVEEYNLYHNGGPYYVKVDDEIMAGYYASRDAEETVVRELLGMTPDDAFDPT